MQNKKKCYDCTNFKTLTINKYNIKKFPIAQCIRVKNRFKLSKEVPIFYCKFGILPQPVYITLNPLHLQQRINKKCHLYDISDPFKLL